MKKLPTRMLPALAVAPVLFSSTAVAGDAFQDAGTLLGGEGFGRNEVVILAVVMAVAIGVVVYLRWRKSK
ncbi:MAG: hypothetical protein ACO4B5_10165 [Steroidobacteraceae bacterium]